MSGMMWIWMAGTALAQSVPNDRPNVPSAGIAAESGPGALWVNPANIAYDPDPRYAFFMSRNLSDSPTSAGFTTGLNGLSLGLHNVQLPQADGQLRSDWGLDYGTSIALPKRWAIGGRLSWKLVDGGQNFVAYDAGVSWRPLPWIGLSGVAQNIADPDPRALVRPYTTGGVALRPLGRALVLGADVGRRFLAQGYEDIGTLTARVRPIEGLYLRGNVATDIGADGLALRSYGAGIELYLDGIGIGVHGSAQDVDQGGTVWIGTDEPGESLVASGRRASELSLFETPAYEPRRGLLGGPPDPSWLDTIELLRRIETDKTVRGLVLTLGSPGMSWAHYQELRDRLVALEAAGKEVVVYLYGMPTNGAYYTASAASRVLVHPAGGVNLVGLNLERTYLRQTLDMIGVTPQVVRRSEYKSAMETFTDHEPSPSTLEQDNALLDDLFNSLVDGIAAGRETDAETVRRWIDGGPWSASEAVTQGLVDGVAYPDELDAEVERLHGIKLSLTDLYDMPQPHSPWVEADQIAVIYITGAIVSGPSSAGGLFSGRTAGAGTLVHQLDRARDNPHVKAIVLRVDSPGGSAFASDEIWRAVVRVKDSGKPVVVSMGGVAASGGYYVSAGADAIYAEPDTITGSIGVIVAKFSVDGLYEHLGVSASSLSRGRNAGIYSAGHPWDASQVERIESLTEDMYTQFKSKVAEGRGLTDAEVEEIARGRVWSGTRALDIGLIDQLGGLQDAIDDARQRAGIKDGQKVALVSLSGSGSVLESLSPALMRVVSPNLNNDQPLSQLFEHPLAVIARHPEERVWMLLPEQLEVGPR